MIEFMTISKHVIEAILKAESDAILSLPKDNPYEKAIDAIHASVKGHGTVVVSGVGKAGDIGQKISSTFNSVGIRSVFLSPLNAAHGDLGIVHKNSVLLVLSNSGKTDELLELIALVRNLHRTVKVIAITGSKKSPIAALSNIVLYTGNPEEVGPLGLVPTTSTTTMLVIGDILTVLSMDKRKFTVHEYQKHHHGGYIGKRAKKLAKRK
jgi:arabinose-5-phosphate isomerase